MKGHSRKDEPDAPRCIRERQMAAASSIFMCLSEGPCIMHSCITCDEGKQGQLKPAKQMGVYQRTTSASSCLSLAFLIG